MNLSKYLCENVQSMALVNESIHVRDIDKAVKNIKAYLTKQGVYPYPFQIPLSKDGKTKFGVLVWTDKNTGACFCWDSKDTASIESILFTSNFDKVLDNIINYENAVWDISFECKGASMVRIVKLVTDVLNNKIKMDAKSIHDSIKDAMIWESLMEDVDLKRIDEADINDLKRQRDNLYMKIKNWKKKGKDVTDLETQYEDIKKQMSELRGQVRANVSTKPQRDPELDKFEEQFEEEVRVTPEERFSDMESYIHKVIIGFKPLAVICGAPGVGKTYRIMKAIQSFGKQKGSDYGLIKGKSTAANLYMTLHDYKNDGQLVVIDDADEVVKDDVAINLIKAACDSSDERWVSWGTARPPEMPEEKAMMCDDAVATGNGKFFYPKEFEMRGGLIIITNMNAGQLDTAIKNRGLLCDLNFTTQEVLDLVRGIAPKIMPNILTAESKERALGYLQELADKGSPMEISIRSFTLVAGLFLDDAPEAVIQRRIREQMKLQFARGGRRY